MKVWKRFIIAHGFMEAARTIKLAVNNWKVKHHSQFHGLSKRNGFNLWRLKQDYVGMQYKQPVVETELV